MNLAHLEAELAAAQKREDRIRALIASRRGVFGPISASIVYVADLEAILDGAEPKGAEKPSRELDTNALIAEGYYDCGFYE